MEDVDVGVGFGVGHWLCGSRFVRCGADRPHFHILYRTHRRKSECVSQELNTHCQLLQVEVRVEFDVAQQTHKRSLQHELMTDKETLALELA